MMYGEWDHQLNPAMKFITDFLQGANECMRVYTNQIKANWRAVGSVPPNNKNFEDLALGGLQS
jgi:hypothetical protein